MAITVKHKFVSAIPDAGDPTIVQPSNWNDTHDLTGTVPIANGGTNATTAADALTNLGAYPASNPAGYGTGSVTSVAATAGTGIAVTGSPITTNGTLNITNTAPDQTVVLNAGSGISTSGTYPNFTITNTSPSSGGTVTSVTGTSPVVSSGGNTPSISLATAYGDTLNPYASKTANYVLASPSGSAGVPSFRALTATDIPSLSGTYIPYTGASTSIDLNAQTVTNIAHLGINTTSVPTILIRAIGDNNSGSRIAMRGYSSNANSSSIRVTKFRGTFAAPQAPQSGDSLGKFELAGYGTTSSDGYPQASYEGVATEAWGATARGTKALFYVTPNTTTTQTLALTIDQNSAATFASTVTATSFSGSGSSLTGVVTSVTGTSPVVSSGGQTPAISMAAANGTTNGYLTSTDWTTFNNKSNTNGTVTSVAALTIGTTGTDLSSTVATGTTTPVITLQVPTASATNRGALSAADWTTFNSKQPAGSYLTAVTADAPLSGSGTSASHLVIATANTTTTGAISSADWNTFNGKQAALVSGTNIKTVNGTTLLGSGDLGTITYAYGGTGQTSVTTGDLLYGSATNTWSKLGIGTTGQILRVVSGAPAWGTDYTGTVTSVGGTGTVNGLTLTGTVTTSGNLTLGGTLDLSSPPAIGGTAAAAGAFTTLSASSTVSGTGFSTYLASPPAIGGTAAAAITGTTITATKFVGVSGGTF